MTVCRKAVVCVCLVMQRQLLWNVSRLFLARREDTAGSEIGFTLEQSMILFLATLR
jgi:hypothetical protein